MSEPFVSEIRMFAGSFPPVGWAFCNGQLLSTTTYSTLFLLLGNNFGGDGRSNFALPNLQGSAPLGSGNGPGLTPRVIGETGGSATVTLQNGQIPAHGHTALAAAAGGEDFPTGNTWGESQLGKTPFNGYSPSGPDNVPMHAQALAPAGASAPHNNLPPYLTVSFIIALNGIFPAHS